MEASATCVSSTYEIDVNINFTGLEEQHNGLRLYVSKQIQVLDYFFGIVTVRTETIQGRRVHLLTLEFPEVKNIIGRVINVGAAPFFALKTFDNVSMQNFTRTPTPGRHQGKAREYLVYKFHEHLDERKLKSVCGTVRISFQASNGQLMKQSLIHGFSGINPQLRKAILGKNKTSPNASQPQEEIKIICGDTSIMFDKTLLCSISDVFKTMFENPNNVEHQRGAVCLEEIDPSTVKALERFLKSHIVKEDDLNVAMLLFADRYNIQPIVQLCLNHLRKNVTKDNFVEIAKASDLINDKDLHQAAVTFASKNVGKFDDDLEVRNFMRSNPECFAKIFENMMFKK